jgi:hypothetical protein
MRLGQNGAAFGAVRRLMPVSQASSSSVLCAFFVGKAPITPSLQAASTRSGPETRQHGRRD